MGLLLFQKVRAHDDNAEAADGRIVTGAGAKCSYSECKSGSR